MTVGVVAGLSCVTQSGLVWCAWGDRLTQVGDLVLSSCLFNEVSNLTAVCLHVPLSEKESHWVRIVSP